METNRAYASYTVRTERSGIKPKKGKTKMRETNYIVQFIRKDNQPNEEYIYPNLKDAEHHYNLFKTDDSELYTDIKLLSWTGDKTTVLKSIQFEI